VIRNVLELHLDNDTIETVLAELGDVMLTTATAAPSDFPLIDSGTVRQYDYGLTLDEVTVTFDADLEIGMPTSNVESFVDASGGQVVDEDDDWATVRLSAVRLICVAQVRSELDQAEITEVSVGLADD
jgi:hypothetical protein